jgi:hypothetical protein
MQNGVVVAKLITSYEITTALKEMSEKSLAEIFGMPKFPRLSLKQYGISSLLEHEFGTVGQLAKAKLSQISANLDLGDNRCKDALRDYQRIIATQNDYCDRQDD